MLLESMVFDYEGDDGSRIMWWFKRAMNAIALCLRNDLPEAAACLI